MKRIVIAPREGRRIEYEVGECMACLENAGIRDYSARLERYGIERYGVFWVRGSRFAIAVNALTHVGFKIATTVKSREATMLFTDRCPPRIATSTTSSEPFIDYES